NTTVEEIAKLYIEAMRIIQPTGPYNLAAMCAGSFIALEMCHQLESAGQAIGRLILLDPTPTLPRLKPQMKNAKKAAKRASKQG
ncbi:thioesterase domain-containing protein, partial [Salmonella sp. SAL4443]|uniref:thioesterase domain-containing protein n=1 Tax=Salmonella sp. SAL4443 TaxID=3159898 RepID=UPI00397E2644